eukprot:scaffold137484_cov23-Tisochrysis_lutea.AAC.1
MQGRQREQLREPQLGEALGTALGERLKGGRRRRRRVEPERRKSLGRGLKGVRSLPRQPMSTLRSQRTLQR